MSTNVNYNPFSNITNGFSVPSVVTFPKNVSSAGNNTQTSKPSPSSDTVTINGETKLPDGKKGKMSLSRKVLYSTLAIGTIALLFTKGISGGTARRIKSWADKLENGLLISSRKNKVAKVVDRGISHAAKVSRRIFSLSNVIANITALKDTGFRKLYSLNFLKFKKPSNFVTKGWNGIMNLPTRFFNFMTKNIMKITESAIDSNYQKAANSLDEFVAYTNKAMKKASASGSKRRVLALANELCPTFRSGFSKTARDGRMEKLYDGFSNLGSDVSSAIVYPFKAFRKKGASISEKFRDFGARLKAVYGSYITSAQSRTVKASHQKAINNAKRALSNNVGDVTKSLRTIANDLKHCLDVKDIDSRCAIGEILAKIEKYGELAGQNESKARGILKRQIIGSLDDLLKKVPRYVKSHKKDGSIVKYTASEISNMTSLVKSIKQTLGKNSKMGKVQKLLAEAKKVLPKKEYEALKSEAGKLNTILNKAIDAEGNSLCDKVAESIVGSVPTDIMFQGLAIGSAGYHIAKGEDKNEKIGTSLKLGMPILGGFATYFYSASKALSGATNLALTALSGFVLNRIGDAIFKYYQKRYVEKKPVNEIAKEAIDNATKS